MPVRSRPVWRVQSGSYARWFWDEADAKEYAKARFEYDLDGVPFVSQMSDAEMLARLNQLEAVEDPRSSIA